MSKNNLSTVSGISHNSDVLQGFQAKVCMKRLVDAGHLRYLLSFNQQSINLVSIIVKNHNIKYKYVLNINI